MKKIISLLIVLSVIFSAITVCYAESSSYISVENIVNKGYITVETPESNGNAVTFAGTCSLGAGYNINLKITDSEGKIYALADTTSKNMGAWNIETKLSLSASNKKLTAYIKGSGDDEASTVDFTYYGLTTASSFITLDEISENGYITLNAPECVDYPIIFSGTYSLGAGYDITLRIENSETKEVYAVCDTVSKNKGIFSFTVELPEESFDKNLEAYIKGLRDDEASYIAFSFTGGRQKDKLLTAGFISEIESLIEKCGNNNIATDYEEVSLGVIKRFDGFLDNYVKDGLTAEYAHNYGVVLKLCHETIDTLKGYLDGTIAEKSAPMYISSDVTTDGKSFIAKTEENGVIKEQPVFFNGYGHWSDSVSDYESFAELGINTSHYEVGLSSILTDEGDDYGINSKKIEEVKNVFKTAEENNLSLMFMPVTHYFPQFIYDKYPEINNNGSETFHDYVPFNPTHPEVMRAIEAFYRAIIPEIKDYKSFQSVCIAGEPLFVVGEYPDYYLPFYQDFLEKKYGSISALNTAYNKSYKSFDAVKMPSNRSVGARWSDYREFNDSILTEWQKQMAEIIYDIDPEILVHTKCSAYISSANEGARRNYCGTNYEEWSEFLNVNGGDAWAIYGEAYSTVQGKMLWYDFQTSLLDAPVVNSEDHFLRDKTEVTYNENELAMNMADVWQGAIHGRGVSEYWLWDKSARAEAGTQYYNSNLTVRADYIAGIGKLNLDMNRLAEEITAIQKKPAKVAIMYSDNTQVGIAYHNNAMYQAYTHLLYNGEKAFIVSDERPELLNENENLEVLIVPVCEYMEEDTWREIQKFQSKGKKVIFAEYNNTYYTENGGELDSSLKNDVLSKAVRVSFGGIDNNIYVTGCEALHSAINSAISGFEKPVTVTSSNGETEWTAAEYNGGYVVNLCNYGEESAEIVIEAPGSGLISTVFDLTNNKTSGESFTLKPFETRLVRISAETARTSFYNADGTEIFDVTSNDITVKTEAKVEANKEYCHFVAVYSENTLLKVSSAKGAADESGNIVSEVNITIPDGTDISKCSIKAYLFENMKTLKPYMKVELLGE